MTASVTVTPATIPMMIEAPGVTNAQGAVIDTRPARQPLTVSEKSGLRDQLIAALFTSVANKHQGADLALTSAACDAAMRAAFARFGFQTAEMMGPAFTDYLKEEGLDAIIAARQSAGETGKAATERSSRFAKIAMRSGPGSGGHLARQVGLRAELVPASDPTASAARTSPNPVLVRPIGPGLTA